MTDEEKIKTAKRILDYHFGVRAPSGNNVCYRCENELWPCPPALLAQAVQEEVLAR
jgi:hypothetical protein